jgi:hypothetical protein
MGILYRTRDGLTDYGFSIVRLRDGAFRAHIENQPPYGERDASLAATHRGQDARGYYVESRPIWTPEAARELAARWAEANQHYLATGQWEWNLDIAARHLGVVYKVLDDYSFARDLALGRSVFLLPRFAPPGFQFQRGARITYAVFMDDQGRGLQARDIRSA